MNKRFAIVLTMMAVVAILSMLVGGMYRAHEQEGLVELTPRVEITPFENDFPEVVFSTCEMVRGDLPEPQEGECFQNSLGEGRSLIEGMECRMTISEDRSFTTVQCGADIYNSDSHYAGQYLLPPHGPKVIFRFDEEKGWIFSQY